MGRAMGQPVRDPEEEVPLVAIDDHLARILGSVQVLPSRSVRLSEAWGCVLGGDVTAPRDLPPFESSAMDGYAVRAADIRGASEQNPVVLELAGEVRIGRAATVPLEAGRAIAISTGAVVPPGADVVVPVELTARDGNRVLVLRELPAGKHVRIAGEDVRAGDVVVPAGRRLRAPDIGALAGSGLADVDVIPRVRVGILSTGDELVRPGSRLEVAQIYDSNTFTLMSAVREFDGVAVDGGPVSDDPSALIDALGAVYDDVDVFVCSGGVSMGERDPVKRAFEDGGEVGFANVAMQPGRPQAFGTWRGKPFFGLPGNPISVFVSFEVFVRPALAKMCGRTDMRPTVDAVLDGSLEAPNTRSRYARVNVRRDGGRFIATPEGGHQSNLLVTFAKADGLAFVPAGSAIVNGDTCRVTLIRDV